MPATSSSDTSLVRRAAANGRLPVLAAAVAVLLTIAGNGAAADAPAFRPGERLTFVLKWTIIPAGEAILEVRPAASIAGGDGAHHFVLTARSNAFVDAFYMVRDRIDAWADAAMTRSLHYRQRQREGRTRRDVTVTFDWASMTAQYVNRGVKKPPITITPGTFDPLSVFYWSRSAALAVGETLRRPVTDGKKHVLGAADVIRRETVRVPAGTFDTFLIEPDLAHIGGVFEKSPDAKIQLWVTADHRRLPVRLRSKVIVGRFSGELVRVDGAARRRDAPNEDQ